MTYRFVIQDFNSEFTKQESHARTLLSLPGNKEDEEEKKMAETPSNFHVQADVNSTVPCKTEASAVVREDARRQQNRVRFSLVVT